MPKPAKPEPHKKRTPNIEHRMSKEYYHYLLLRANPPRPSGTSVQVRRRGILRLLITYDRLLNFKPGTSVIVCESLVAKLSEPWYTDL